MNYVRSLPHAWRRKLLAGAAGIVLTAGADAPLCLAADPGEPPALVQNEPLAGGAALGVTLRDDAEGVVVASVMPNSPAADAGIRNGDRILGIGDQLVSTSSDVIYQIAARRPGEKAAIRIDRAGLKGSLRAVLASRSEVNRRAALGVTLSRGTHGSVRVLAVAPNSPAAKAGLRMGDRIVAIDEHVVASYRDVIDWIGAEHPGDRVRLKIDRYGLEGQLVATLSGEEQVFQAPAPVPAPAVVAAPSPEDLLFENTPAQIDDQRGYGD